MNKFYILIDRLDDRWVDTSVRFKLIKSLIEALRSFRRIVNLKILVSLRSDILERVVQETGDVTFQREKFDDYFIRLKWSRDQLRDLVQKRIALLFRRQYTRDNILFDDVFPYKVANTDPFQYILDRTLMRPRDVISFINECLSKADGRYEVTAKMVREAETEFSRIRKQALENEWKSAFPTLQELLNLLASIGKSSFEFREMQQIDLIEKLALQIGGATKIDFDPLHALAARVFETPDGPQVFMQEVVATLYRVGAVGVKLRPNERHIYSHLDQPIVDRALITPEVRVRVHPMLHRALNIQM